MSLTSNQLAQALQRVRPYVRHTPTLENEAFNNSLGLRLLFKCENTQRIGAFKARGAFNALLSLPDGELNKGVAAHSSGNHAQALALAAATLQTKAYIVMPENSPRVKVNGVRELGGHITFCAPTLDSRERMLAEVIAETGAHFIPPYDHEDIIAGQATAAMEIFSDHPNPDAIFAPLGGGGLLSGTSAAAHHLSPSTKVYGTEPESVNDGQRSFRSGKLEKNFPEAYTIADGLRTHLSPLTLKYIRNYVTDVYTCTEKEIVEAMELIWSRLKIIAEPSSAVPLAVVIKNKESFQNQTVAVILSGGNVDFESVPFLN